MQPLLEGPVERAEVDSTRLLLPTRNVVEEMTTIRQKSNGEMITLLAGAVGGCHLCDFSARRGDPQQPTRRLPKENHPVAAPGATLRDRRIAKRLYRGACHIDLLEPGVGEEADEAAVGRPEEAPRVLRARQRPIFV